MTTIVISGGHILVNDEDRYPLDFEAYCIKNEIGIRHINQKDIILGPHRMKPNEVTLNGITYANALAFVYAFNSLIAIPIFNYSNTPFSARITANAETHIADYAYPGYVTIKAHGDNGGNVYIGPTGLAAGSGQLAPGESVAYEVDDLSTLFALNVAAGYVIDVFGGYYQ